VKKKEGNLGLVGTLEQEIKRQGIVEAKVLQTQASQTRKKKTPNEALRIKRRKKKQANWISETKKNARPIHKL